MSVIIREIETGRKMYYPWFNSTQGKFVVLDREFRSGHGTSDRYDIMLCESWDEAKKFTDDLNGSIQSVIENRKETLRNE